VDGGKGLVTAFDRQGDVRMANNKWKKGLLSSGLALEYQTARILAKSGFALYPDYLYERIEAGQTKDFSVDWNADLYFPTSNPNRVTASLQLLIECKYRTPNKTWVFLPYVQRPGFFIPRGYTIRPIDQFSFCKVWLEPLWDFERNAPFCYKGIEIDLSKGRGYDAEIRRGLNQLQYGLPRLISESILFQVWRHTEDIIPLFVLPILVTTADLRVLKRGTTLRGVENSRVLEDITRKVPFLDVSNSFGPDFIAHSQRYFRRLARLDEYESVRNIAERLRASGLVLVESFFPSFWGMRMAEGQYTALGQYCGQFMVCTLEVLPELLEMVNQAIRSSLRRRKRF